MNKYLILAFLSLYGCTHHQGIKWQHPTKNDIEQKTDEQKCKYIVCGQKIKRQRIQESHLFKHKNPNGGGSISASDIIFYTKDIQSCMQEKGWELDNPDNKFTRMYSCFY